MTKFKIWIISLMQVLAMGAVANEANLKVPGNDRFDPKNPYLLVSLGMI